MRQEQIDPNDILEWISLGPCIGAGGIIEERQKRDEAYKMLLREFVPCVVGEVMWKKKRSTKLMTNIATASDEGFIIAVFESFKDNWDDLLKNKLEKSVWNRRNKLRIAAGRDLLSKDELACSPKYSDGGAGCTEQGWKDVGILRYSELCLKAKGWRKSPHCQKIYAAVRNEYKEKEHELLAMVPKRKVDAMPDGYNDLEDSDEDEDEEKEEAGEDDQNGGSDDDDDKEDDDDDVARRSRDDAGNSLYDADEDEMELRTTPKTAV